MEGKEPILELSLGKSPNDLEGEALEVLRENYMMFLDELAEVPLPAKEYPLDNQRLRDYIEHGEYSKIKSKRLRRLIVKNTYYISNKELVGYICNSLERFLIEQDNRPYAIVLFNQEHESYDYTKSYGWVLRLCLENCKAIKKNPPLGLVLCPSDLDKIKPLIHSGKLNDLVILDEISYSGNQIRGLVYYIHDKLDEYNIKENVRISAIVGVISGTSVFFNKDDPFNKYEIGLYYSKKIPGYLDLLSEEDFKVLEEGDIYERLGSPNIYSSHKLPDAYSIFVSEIAPLISGCEDFYSKGKGFNDLEPPCPQIPYKNVAYKTRKDYKCYSEYLRSDEDTKR